MSDTFQRVAVLYRAIVSFVSEIGFISSKCKQFLIADDGFSGIQIGYLFYQSIVWKNVARDKNVIVRESRRIFGCHIFGCEIGVHAG